MTQNLSLVPYNSNSGHKWTAATNIKNMIQGIPGGLDKYHPKMEYLLLAEREYSDATLASLKNLVAALFRLENIPKPEDLLKVVRNLLE